MAQPLNKPDLLNPYKAQELQTSTEEAVLTQLDEFRANNIPKVEAIRAELKATEKALNDIREEARQADMLERVQTLVPSLKKLPSNERDKISMRLLEERDFKTVSTHLRRNEYWNKCCDLANSVINFMMTAFVLAGITITAKYSIDALTLLTKNRQRAEEGAGLIFAGLAGIYIYKTGQVLHSFLKERQLRKVVQDIEKLPKSSLTATSPIEDSKTPNP